MFSWSPFESSVIYLITKYICPLVKDFQQLKWTWSTTHTAKLLIAEQIMSIHVSIIRFWISFSIILHSMLVRLTRR